jgi:hypothetical protein
MRWIAIGALMLATLSACGAKVSSTKVDTPAEAIDQPAPGLSLLAAAPVPKKRLLRLVAGGEAGLSQAPGHGTDGTALYMPPAAYDGQLMFGLTENLELGVTARWAATRGDSEAGSPPRPDGDRPGQAGIRLRGVTRGETLRLGWAVESGMRQTNLAYGVSVACDVDEVGSEWVPIDGTCRASRRLQGKPFEKDQFYLAAAVYPVIRLADGLYVYAGVAFDEVTSGYERSEVTTTYEDGSTVLEKSDEKFDQEGVVLAVAGLDLSFDDRVGLLLTVQGPPFGTIDLPGPTFEGALSLSF